MSEKTFLSRPVRIGIMICLIVSFFVVSPLVILYTIGYRYDISTGIVRETGVLSIDVEPRDAAISLDSVAIQKRLPIRLTNLIPGTYQLSIQADGRYPWEKEILIESKQTTYIRNITLFRQDTPKTAFTVDESIVDARGSYDGSFLLLTTVQDDVYEILLLNTRTGEQTILVRAEADRPPTLTWSEFQHDAFVEIFHEGTTRLYLFSATNPGAIRSYTYRATMEQHPYQWPRASTEPTLFVEENGTVYRITMQDERQVGSTQTSVWHVSEDGLLWTAQAGRQSLVQANEPETILYQTNEPIERIIAVRSNFLLIKTASGVRVLGRDGSRIEQTASLPTHNTRFNHSTGEWMSWSPWEIWSIYEDGSTALLNRISEQVSDVRPLDQFGVLLLVREQSMTAFNPGYFVHQPLLEKTDLDLVAIDPEERMMYLMRPDTETIERLLY